MGRVPITTIFDASRVEWMRDMRRAGLAAGTIEKRESATRRLLEHSGRARMLDVDRADIEAWLDARPDICARTRYGEISHIAAFYRWAILEELTDHDPTVRITRPKVRNGLPRPIATEDLAHALDQAPTAELSAMLMLAAYGGLRCAEISGLTVDNVLDRHDPPLMVVYGKGGRERVVPLHPAVHAALRRHGMPIRGRVFDRPPWRVSHLLRAHLVACGIDASAHQLRHWFATSTYELSGGDLRLVQELLGHSSPTTTAIYTSWSRAKAMHVVAQLGAA
jgi:site-specific recombinase XerD